MEKLNQIAQIAYSTQRTVVNTYLLAKNVLSWEIPGSLVECGVGAGAQIAAMKIALMECQSPKQIFAFDSFEGIPLAGPNDDSQPGIGKPTHNVTLPERDRLVSSGVTAHSLENVKGNFKQLDIPLDNIEFVKGWFQDTLPNNTIDKIALLRLDGDLYESTLCCLQHLYHKVSIGGIVIVDDLALPGSMKAVQEYFGHLPEFNIVPDSGGVGWFVKN